MFVSLVEAILDAFGLCKAPKTFRDAWKGDDLASHPPAGDEPGDTDETQETPATDGCDYCPIGTFTPTEAKTVLDLLKSKNLRFQVRCDTSGGPPSDEGFYRDRTTIGVYVHPDDSVRARISVDDWRIKVGKVSPSPQSDQ